MNQRIGTPIESPPVRVVGRRASVPNAPSTTSLSPVRTRVDHAAAKPHHNVDETNKSMKAAKPSEIRAASKVGRATAKAEREKQQRMLKEQQAAHMKMNKIRAEIEAIKQKERDAKGGSTKTDSKNVVGNKIYSSDGMISSLEKDDDSEKNGEIEHQEMGKRELRKIKSSQLQRAASREKLSMSTSYLVPEMRRKASKQDLLFCSDQTDSVDDSSSSTTASKGEHARLSPKTSPVTIVRRGSVIPTIQAPSLDKKQLAKKEEEKQKMEAQRKKLEEARAYFEEGHRLCWKFQDSHSALGEYRNALFIREGLLGKYHEDTGKTYYWVGRSLCKIKEHDEALVAFSRAMRIFVCVVAQNHKYRKWTDTAIEEAFNEMGDPDVDYNLYKAALDDSIAHEVKGDNFRKHNLLAQAISEYLAAIETIQECHPDAADLHSKIAIILSRMGEFEKALEENRFALEIYELSLGPDHPDTVKTLNRTMEKKRLNQVSLALQEKLNLRNHT